MKRNAIISDLNTGDTYKVKTDQEAKMVLLNHIIELIKNGLNLRGDNTLNVEAGTNSEGEEFAYSSRFDLLVTIQN